MTLMMIEQSYKSKTIALQLGLLRSANTLFDRWRPFGPEHRQRMHDRVLNRTKAPKTEPIQSALTTGEHCKSPR